MRHQEADHSSAASKDPSTHRSRIMSNISYAPPEYESLLFSLYLESLSKNSEIEISNFIKFGVALCNV